MLQTRKPGYWQCRFCVQDWPLFWWLDDVIEDEAGNAESLLLRLCGPSPTAGKQFGVVAASLPRKMAGHEVRSAPRLFLSRGTRSNPTTGQPGSLMIRPPCLRLASQAKALSN
jgi:hypothetical protein